MDYRPNVDAALWFALEVLPRIQRSVPDAHFTVVGQKPHPRLDRLRELPGVTLTGQVPDIRPFIQAADVYVAPLRMGSGTRLKLLEAMAMERAIVSTRLGAEGLEAAAGEALVIADQPGSFASAVVDLLQDAARRQILGRQASALVRARYDWPVIIPRVEAVYERL
jgi:glycosyltransferase involved in cell wall biosynthesis